jgi:hypothetical protein
MLLSACVPQLRPIPAGQRPIVVRAVLVQANMALFDASNGRDYPALVVFSLDEHIERERLHWLARLSMSLKGTEPSNPTLRVIARQPTDEDYEPDEFVEAPPSIIGVRGIYFAEIWVERSRLRDHVVDRDLSVAVYLQGGVPYTIRHVGEWGE